MKPYILPFLLLSLLHQPSQAQEMFPVGAEWHYESVTYLHSLTYIRYFRYYIPKDTMIMGKECKKVERFSFEGEKGTFGFLYEEDKRVYRYLSRAHAFGLLYDFSLNAGDSYIITMNYTSGDTLETARIYVDSVETIFINQIERKVQYLRSINREWYFGGMTIEGIGNVGDLTPKSGLAGGPGTLLRCYQDLTLGLFWYRSLYALYAGQENDTIPCDTIWNVLASSIDKTSQKQFHTYPNPIQDQLSIRVDKASPSISHIRLFDTQGRNIHQQAFIAPKREWMLDMRAYQAGIYLLEVQLLSGERLLRKVWKQ